MGAELHYKLKEREIVEEKTQKDYVAEGTNPEGLPITLKHFINKTRTALGSI